MSSNAANSNDSAFVTPDPSFLQSDGNQADVQGHYSVPEEVVAGEAELPESSSGDRTFDPDEVSRGADDGAIAPHNQNQDNPINRQIGNTFRSGS